MQVGGTVQGASNIPGRGRRLQALLAVATILVIAAMALLVWAFPPASSGNGAQAANPNAGAPVIHDDAGNMPSTGTGAAIVHDDAGNVR